MIEDAKVESAAGNIAPAAKALQDALAQARKHNLVGLQYEARLALGETEIKTGNVESARVHLASLERDARKKQFLRIARKAHAARTGNHG
jgi:thioredoxin-like negative regulator of GroEL